MDSKIELKYGSAAPQVFEFIKTLDINISDNLDLLDGDTINVSTAQIALREHTSLPDYIREMEFIISQGVNQRAHIICLPAFAGFLPAPLFPQYKKTMDLIKMDQITGLPHSIWIYQAVSALASECLEVFTATMSGLAQAHKVYIMGGTIIYPERGSFKHRAVLFGPDGDIVGLQDKIVAGRLEKDLQIESAGEIKVFETLMGNISILLTDDTLYFEAAKIAKNLGADVILNPTAFIAPYTGADEAAGLNVRVQENNIYGVQSALIGNTPFGFTLGGYSGVYGPLKFSLPNAKNAMYIKTIKRNQTQISTARLSASDLDKKLDPLHSDENYNFMKKYIDLLY